MTADLTDAQRIAQQAAEYACACAASTNSAVCTWTGDIYRLAHEAFRAAVTHAYGLTETEATIVIDLLAEYGPDDTLQDNPEHYGVFSYVQEAHRASAGNHAIEAQRLAYNEVAWPDDDDGSDWATYRDGERVFTALLAGYQVGAYLRHLGPGYTVQYAGGSLADWERELLRGA